MSDRRDPRGWTESSPLPVWLFLPSISPRRPPITNGTISTFSAHLGFRHGETMRRAGRDREDLTHALMTQVPPCMKGSTSVPLGVPCHGRILTCEPSACGGNPRFHRTRTAPFEPWLATTRPRIH